MLKNERLKYKTPENFSMLFFKKSNLLCAKMNTYLAIWVENIHLGALKTLIFEKIGTVKLSEICMVKFEKL